MRKYAAAAMVIVVAVLGLAGCTDDDPPPPKPSPSLGSGGVDPPSSSAATPDATAGLKPEQVVRAWIEARNEALRTGDTSAALELATDDCKACRNELDPVADVYDRGGWFKGGRWTVAGAKETSNTGKRAVVPAGIDVAAGRTKASSSANPVSYPSEKFIHEFTLRNVGGSWFIAKIVRL